MRTSDMPSGADRRDRLLEAAYAVFAERGYHGATVREIARRANVAPALINYHFQGKANLYAAVLRRTTGDLARRLGLRLLADGSPVERLVRVAHEFYDYVQERGGAVRLLLREVLDNPELIRASAGAMRPGFELVEAFVREQQAAGRLRPGDPLLAIHHLMASAIHLAVIAPALTPEWDDGRTHEDRKNALGALVRALVAHEPETCTP